MNDKKRHKKSNVIGLLVLIFATMFLLATIIINFNLYFMKQNFRFIFSYISIAILFTLFSCCDVYVCKHYRFQCIDVSLKNKKLVQIIKTIFFSWLLLLTAINVLCDQLKITNDTISFNMAILIFLVACDRVVSNIDKLFEIEKKRNELNKDKT